MRTFALAAKLPKDGCSGGRELQLEVDLDPLAMALIHLFYKLPASVFGIRR